jgi:chromosomal replication initiator protein
VNAKQIWQTTIERIQARVDDATFTTWFAGTYALSYKEDVFVVGVPTNFVKVQLDSRFRAMVLTSLMEVIGRPVILQFEVARENEGQNDHHEPALSPPKRLYRFAKGRLSARRVKRQNEAAPAAMNSTTLSATPHSNAHLSPEPGQDVEISQAPLALPVPPPGQLMTPAPPVPLVPPAPANGLRKEREKQVPFFQSSLKAAPQAVPLPFPGEGLLNPRYTFNSFIVGKSNQLAHAASMAVSENPGRIYNPLFLYGGVGLGKTHLLHAVGHVGEAAGLTVLYTTSEKFTNEIINAIRYQKTDEFRARYRQIDILLVDDIQFIAGKESTEEEFFHTFNSLHDANKQIVVTSDRPPKDISSLQDRLRSRFEWGLLADVQPPEYEHRLAILRSKCESLHFVVPASVIDYIARPPASSVRELEGALNRVIAYATLHDAPLSVSLAAQALENIYNNKKPSTTATLSVAEVLEGVCRYYNVQAERIRGKSRDRESVWPRQVAMYLMREATSASLLQIGSELGGRDHTTIMHGWEKVQAAIKHNDRVRHEIAAVLESIQHK